MKRTFLTASLTVAGLFAGSASAATITWQGGSGSFSDANWDIDGTPNQSHPAYNSDSIETIIAGGTVTGFNDSATSGIGSNDSITISGGAIVTGDYFRPPAGSTPGIITLVSGTLTMTDSNPFRTSSGSFVGNINFTGPAGSATVVTTDLSVQSIASKISAGGGSQSFFAIDGTEIEPGLSYNGSNLASLNAALADQAVNDRYFEIVESGGSQTLYLRAVPEPGSLALLGLGGLLIVRRRRG